MYFPVSGVEVSPLIPLAVCFVVSIFRLPIHTTVGATLFETFLSSIGGALFRAFLACS
jgi:hypothetical protein